MLADSRVVSMLTLFTSGSRIEHRTYNIYMVWVLQFLIKGVVGGCYCPGILLALLTILPSVSRVPLTLLQPLGSGYPYTSFPNRQNCRKQSPVLASSSSARISARVFAAPSSLPLPRTFKPRWIAAASRVSQGPGTVRSSSDSLARTLTGRDRVSDPSR